MMENQGNGSGSAEKAHRQAVSAHDIRNELQTILSTVDLFVEGAGDGASARQTAVNIRKAAERALDLVNGILTSARAEHDQSRQDNSAFHLGARATEIVERMQALAVKKGNELTIDANPFDSPVSGDPRLVDTVILNLLSNANKFTHGGRICLTIDQHVAPDGRDSLVTLSVEDTGEGIAEEKLQRLFLPYESGSARDGDASGFGIGTYAVAEAVKAMGGDIKVDSKPGIGSRFTATFSLPLAQEPAGMATEEPTDQGRDRATRTAKLLVVDDNEVNLDLFVKALSSEAETVTPAKSGDAALECLRSATAGYDLVLTDLNMPGTDGVALAIDLIRSKISSPPRIAALTAEADDSCLETCKALGMVAVIRKPVSPQDLRKRIESIIGAAHGTRAAMPEEVLDTSVTSELGEELGQEVAKTMMRRALDEASRVHASLAQAKGVFQDRNLIHSAIGSAGMTGLARLDHALRIVQAVSKFRPAGTAAFSAALGLLGDTIAETDGALD